jgi:hypothetical protein
VAAFTAEASVGDPEIRMANRATQKREHFSPVRR